MRSKQRGVALIILNSIFPKDSPDKIERRGGTHDAKYLKEFLTQCGEFYVDMKTNVKSTVRIKLPILLIRALNIWQSCQMLKIYKDYKLFFSGSRQCY